MPFPIHKWHFDSRLVLHFQILRGFATSRIRAPATWGLSKSKLSPSHASHDMPSQTTVAETDFRWQDCLTMETRLSTKGQIVLPSPIRRRLGLRSGDPLDAIIEGGRIVLTPLRSRPSKINIVDDPLTGLPVLSAGPKSPLLKSKHVEEILASFR